MRDQQNSTNLGFEHLSARAPAWHLHARDLLAVELRAMKPSARRKRAAAVGAAEEEVEACDDADFKDQLRRVDEAGLVMKGMIAKMYKGECSPLDCGKPLLVFKRAADSFAVETGDLTDEVAKKSYQSQCLGGKYTPKELSERFKARHKDWNAQIEMSRRLEEAVPPPSARQGAGSARGTVELHRREAPSSCFCCGGRPSKKAQEARAGSSPDDNPDPFVQKTRLIQEKEMGSTDPFVQKKIHIQEKIAETNQVRDTQLLALCTSWCPRGRASSRYTAGCARIGPAARRPCDHRLCGRKGWARSAGRDPRGSRRHPMPLRGTHMGARRLRQCRPPLCTRIPLTVRLCTTAACSRYGRAPEQVGQGERGDCQGISSGSERSERAGDPQGGADGNPSAGGEESDRGVSIGRSAPCADAPSLPLCLDVD